MPWSLKDFDRKTDRVVTRFFFFGRGQPFWSATAQNGLIQYPGETAEPGLVPGSEVSCSESEFHEILQEVARLKREGKPMKGNLTLRVFGVESRAK